VARAVTSKPAASKSPSKSKKVPTPPAPVAAPPVRPPGRPTKLTPELVAKICALIRAGNYPEISARASGIGATTYYRWMAEGERLARENLTGPEREFWESVEDAEAEGETQLVLLVRKHAIRTEKAALEALGRRFPKRWGKKEHAEVGGEVNLSTHDDLARKIARLAAGAAAGAGTEPANKG
jgi:hypothetical protein